MILGCFPKAVNVIADRTPGHWTRKKHPFSDVFAAWPLNDPQVVRGSAAGIPEDPAESLLSGFSME